MAREMKDSGIMWIGKIPSNWNITRVKYICESYGRIGFRGYTENDLVDEGEGAITISPSNMKDMKMDYSKCSYLSWNKYEESPEIKLSNNDVLFVKTGSTYGKTAIVENLPMEATINPQLLIFKNIKIYTRYFFYNFQTPYIKSQIENAVVGGTIPTIAQGKINNFFFIIPPVPEQRIIADFLDDKCAEIDGLLADLEAEVKTLAEYKKSIIAETVTRGLNPNAPTKQSGIPWAETIPAHWEMFRLRFVVQIVSDYKNSSSIKVGLENIESWTGKYIPSETEFEGNGNYFGNNDILFGKLRPYLAKVYLAEFEGQAIGDFLVFRTKECAVPKYVKYFLLNPLVIGLINSFTYGAKMPRANWQDISKVFMPIPPIEEQEAIAAYLDEKCAAIDQSIADKQTQIETLKAYKSSLIYEYVTGKKQVI